MYNAHKSSFAWANYLHDEGLLWKPSSSSDGSHICYYHNLFFCTNVIVECSSALIKFKICEISLDDQISFLTKIVQSNF